VVDTCCFCLNYRAQRGPFQSFLLRLLFRLGFFRRTLYCRNCSAWIRCKALRGRTPGLTVR
jgi:hypothetical protein